MNVLINNQPHELPDQATLADAVAAYQPPTPFAAAVNLQFVPNGQYGLRRLQAGDRIDLIAPVTGG